MTKTRIIRGNQLSEHQGKNSTCKGPDVGTNWGVFGNRGEPSAAGVREGRQRGRGHIVEASSAGGRGFIIFYNLLLFSKCDRTCWRVLNREMT